MHIKFVNPGFEYILNSIMEFQKDDSSVFWNDSLFYFFEELDKEYAYSLSAEKRREYFEEKLSEVYKANETLLEEKVQAYSKHWNLHKANITQAFSDAFGVDCLEMFNDLVCNISLNPVSPRYLKEHSFDVFYLNSERGALGNALHELVHFVWFAVWNDLFRDSYEEYENPSLKWILSELVVEAVMSDERLSSINPYYPREQGGCIYPYFFMFWCSHNDIEKTKNWVRKEEEKVNDPNWYRFAIVLRESGALIGTGLIYFEDEVDCWEIAYNLGKAYWGKGYVTEAMREIIAFAHDELGINEIVGRYAKENPGSRNVLKKLGFQYEKDIPYECNRGSVFREGIQCRLYLD